VGVFVHVFEVGLVHVLGRGSARASRGVVTRGVHVCVSLAAVVVFVRMRCVMGVLFAHGDRSKYEIC
jgi:hypothetical protein